MRQYELRCKTSLERGVARFNKQAQDRIKGAGKRVAGRDGSGAEGVETYGHGDGGTSGCPRPAPNFGRGGVHGPRAEGGRTETGEETYGRGDGGDPGARDPRRTSGRGGEQPGDGDARRARAEEWERMEQKLDASDIRACGGFLPLGRTGLASGTLTERSAGAVDVEGDGRSGESATALTGARAFARVGPPPPPAAAPPPRVGRWDRGGHSDAGGCRVWRDSVSATPPPPAAAPPHRVGRKVLRTNLSFMKM